MILIYQAAYVEGNISHSTSAGGGGAENAGKRILKFGNEWLSF